MINCSSSDGEVLGSSLDTNTETNRPDFTFKEFPLMSGHRYVELIRALHIWFGLQLMNPVVLVFVF